MESESEDENREKAPQIQAAKAASKRNLRLLKVSFHDLRFHDRDFAHLCKKVSSEVHNFDWYNVFVVSNK